MSLLILYLVKLTIGLAVVWLFYQFVLRRLTFYKSNRWYFLAYTLLSFFIPFINISPILERSSSTNSFIQVISLINQYTAVLEEASQCPVPIWSTNYDKWDFTALGLMLVAVILLARFLIRYFSFLRMRNRSILISSNGINIYQVDDNIIPFSFGNSVFLNTKLHSEQELQEIIRHEFVHVRQKHTIDIVWAELLCIINWYNPFVWLLKRSMRQNLEFIADNKVIEHGINKKEYQYLLLKVIGNNQYSIATQFNFSSLKKRIVMMNKTKSAKRQLGRFLFLVPVIAIILLSFRKSFSEASVPKIDIRSVTVNDTVPEKMLILNNKGYYVNIIDDNGNCTVVVKDKNKKEVKRMLLKEWNAKREEYENLYGETNITVLEAVGVIKEKNPDITSFAVKGNTVTVTLKNGKTEVYTLSIKDQKKAFEERCGVQEVAVASTIAAEPIEPTLASPVNETVTAVNVANETIAENFEISDNKAVMKLKNGKVEEYNLADPKEKAAFEKKFGKIIKPTVAVGSTVKSVVSVAEVAEPTVATTVSVSPTKEVAVIDEEGNVEGVEMEPLLTITKNTTKDELESFKNILKDKGIELTYDEIKFENGILVRISGSLKSKDANANFVGVDFNKIIISQAKKGEKTYFRVNEVVKKKGVS
jgi:beta-lactamase regulating signal transducer with metallopeptidase domain